MGGMNTQTQDVRLAADRLSEAIKETESYQTYAALRENVLSDAENRALLKRFYSAQTALQMTSLAGKQPTEEEQTQFERISQLMYSSDELTDYLLAQMKVQKMVAELLEHITRDVGLDLPIS